MPDVLATALALLGAIATLWLAYVYLTRWRQRRLLSMPLQPIGYRIHRPLVTTVAALGRTSSVTKLSSRRATVTAILASLVALIGNLMLWADMAAPTCPWLLAGTLPGFAHDLLWHLLWFHASLLFYIIWARSTPDPMVPDARQLVTTGLATIPVTLIGTSGALWLLGSTNLSQLDAHIMAPTPMIALQPLGLAVTLLSFWLASRRTLSRDVWRNSPWPNDFQWQHAGAAMAWMHLCEFLQRVYASGIIVAVFCGGARVLGSSRFGWFALKTGLLLAIMYWLEAKWLKRRDESPSRIASRLMLVGLANLAITALVMAWRLSA